LKLPEFPCHSVPSGSHRLPPSLAPSIRLHASSSFPAANRPGLFSTHQQIPNKPCIPMQ
jgi:hypothetical protein